jgi:hypothetical protein
MAAGTEPSPVDSDPGLAETIQAETIQADPIDGERIEIDAAGWDDRQLCPDGACIGVIGGDGRCTVCGTADPSWSPDRPRAAAPPVAAAVVAPPLAAAGDEPAGWDDRQLCPDGACIGVIGGDGRCTVCGTAAPSPA